MCESLIMSSVLDVVWGVTALQNRRARRLHDTTSQQPLSQRLWRWLQGLLRYLIAVIDVLRIQTH